MPRAEKQRKDLEEFVSVVQKFQRLDLKGEELRSLQSGFIDNFRFLEKLEAVFPDEDTEPATFVRIFLSNAQRQVQSDVE